MPLPIKKGKITVSGDLPVIILCPNWVELITKSRQKKSSKPWAWQYYPHLKVLVLDFETKFIALRHFAESQILPFTTPTVNIIATLLTIFRG